MKKGDWVRVRMNGIKWDVKFSDIVGEHFRFSDKIAHGDRTEKADWFHMNNLIDMKPSDMNYINSVINPLIYEEDVWYIHEMIDGAKFISKVAKEDDGVVWNHVCYDVDDEDKQPHTNGFLVMADIRTQKKATQKEIDSVALKHVDVSIDWKGSHGAIVQHPLGYTEELWKIPVGVPISKYILSGFKFKESGEVIKDTPVKYNKGTSRTSIRSRATHARFIKLGGE